ncbi:MAG: 16S rRNA (cytosine(1402)-N(4))-methyltransferase RsmH [Candidatus Competibacteraceae bacterium]|nr:16S rRNA (cytosine(1402)-N(4))-methyltransferase RsmH [Candidatus Competibacteraceae bacterium]
MEPPHRPVLVEETLDALALRPGGCYVDATFGRGGHAAAILERLGPAGSLLSLDRDPAAEEWAKRRFRHDARFQFARARFSRLSQVLAERGWNGRVDGILLDLGVSSPQLDDPARGFSFLRDGSLDMRMDPTCGDSAAAWLDKVSEKELAQVLVEFGEERFHRRIARAIATARQRAPVATTARLAEIVSAAVPAREPGKHPATRTFQAIRIAVNDELGELQALLPQAVQALVPGGRLAVISFHSLEDRAVKRFIQRQARGRELPLDLPVTGSPEGVTLRRIGRAIRPSAREIAQNPRARSAVLRAAEHLG